MTDRHLVRIDADLFAHFREQGHQQHRHATAIINELLRYVLPLAQAGVLNLPHDVLFAALERYAAELAPAAENPNAPV